MSTRHVWSGAAVCLCVMLCWMGEARVDSAFLSDAMDSNIQKLIKQHVSISLSLLLDLSLSLPLSLSLSLPLS